MTFLPIVDRELRVACRKRGTYWIRIGSAVAALIVGGWIMLLGHSMPPQEMGRVIFGALSVLTFIFAAVTGIGMTSDCLSEEKRDGTLGLLFLTDLKGYDVVFGKLAANSIGSLYGMMATFPVLAISLLLGGVTYSEFWRVALVSVNILFLSLTAGMFASSISRDGRKAASLSFLLLLLLGLGPVVAGAIYNNNHPGSHDYMHLLLTPGYSCVLAFSPKGSEFWLSVAITHLYAWLFLLLACRIVPRSWQDKADSLRKQKAQQAIVEVTQGTVEKRNAFRTSLLNINPFYWLASRDRMQPRLLFIFLVVMAALWTWGWVEFERDWLNPVTYIITAITLHTIIKYWIAGEACRRFTDDRRSGAMELMLSTPITVAEVLQGQKLGLLRQFGGAVVCILIVDFLLMVAGLPEFGSSKDEWVVLWISATVVFVFDLFTLGWLGMWLALTSQKANRAAGGAIARVLFLPWLAFGVTTAVMTLLSVFPLTRKLFRFGNIDENFFTLYWLFLAVVNNVFWIVFAKTRLNARFREIATQRFDTPRPFWNFGKMSKPPVVADR